MLIDLLNGQIKLLTKEVAGRERLNVQILSEDLKKRKGRLEHKKKLLGIAKQKRIQQDFDKLVTQKKEGIPAKIVAEKKQLQELQKQKQQLENNIKKANEILNKKDPIRREQRELTAQNRKLRVKVDKARNKANDQKREVKTLEKLLSATTTERKSSENFLKKALARFQPRSSILNKELKKVQEKIANLKEKEATWGKQKEVAQANLAKSQIKEEQLEKQIEDQSRELEKSFAVLRKAEKKIDDLNIPKKIKKFTDDIDRLKIKILYQEREIEKEQKKLERVSRQITALQEKLAPLKGRKSKDLEPVIIEDQIVQLNKKIKEIEQNIALVKEGFFKDADTILQSSIRMKKHFGTRNCVGIIKEYNKQVDVVNQSKFGFTPTREFFGKFMNWWQNLGAKTKSESKNKNNHTQKQSLSCSNTMIDQLRQGL